MTDERTDYEIQADADWAAAHEMARAIARSVSHTEIVTLQWSAELESALLCESDDSVHDAGRGRWEFWGYDDDGDEWRVHLSGVPPVR